MFWNLCKKNFPYNKIFILCFWKWKRNFFGKKNNETFLGIRNYSPKSFRTSWLLGFNTKVFEARWGMWEAKPLTDRGVFQKNYLEFWSNIFFAPILLATRLKWENFFFLGIFWYVCSPSLKEIGTQLIFLSTFFVLKSLSKKIKM